MCTSCVAIDGRGCVHAGLVIRLARCDGGVRKELVVAYGSGSQHIGPVARTAAHAHTMHDSPSAISLPAIHIFNSLTWCMARKLKSVRMSDNTYDDHCALRGTRWLTATPQSHRVGTKCGNVAGVQPTHDGRAMLRPSPHRPAEFTRRDLHV
jgi:hypothetical protein